MLKVPNPFSSASSLYFIGGLNCIDFLNDFATHGIYGIHGVLGIHSSSITGSVVFGVSHSHRYYYGGHRFFKFNFENIINNYFKLINL